MANDDILECARSRLSLGNGVAAANDMLEILGGENCREHLCFACSGGSDSVFLVHHLLEKFPHLHKRSTLLHFNHNLRSSDSDGDEKFVEQLARSCGVGFYGEKLHSRPEKISEEILRTARNEFFRRAMVKFGSKVLLLGHQRDDVAETLLMRLLRASDVDGLSAPRAVTIFPGGFMKLRPLLEFSREKIINILRANGVEWRSDGSNLENNFLRNRIRNCVLPKLREAAAFTDAIGRLADAKINMEEAADAIAFCADECIARRNISGGMLAGDLRHLPAAICRKIVAKFLDANGVGVRKSRVAPLVDGIRRGKSVTLSAGGERFIHWDGEYLKISERKVPLRWHVENLKIGTHTLPTGDALRIEEVEPGSPLLRNLRTVDTAKMCCAAIPAGANISAENYAANRRYVRFGHRRARKLGDILPAKIYGGSGRDRLPVVFANGEICWVPGLPVADIFCIKDGCESALLLTYLRRAFS